jgi:arylsulfatase A-like enzyme
MSKTSRLNSFVSLLAGAVVLLAVSCPINAQPPRKPAPRLPSIIFILADDLGYGDLGCYGQTMIKTPNIDKLAAEGMKFTDFYAGNTVCAPSRCTLMTGLHTGHSRIRGNGTLPLTAEDFTVAELLRKNGYRTCALGKWGMGELGSSGVPGKQGFDEWFGYLDQVEAHNYYPMVLNRFDGGRLAGDQERQLEITENQGGKKGKYSNDYFTEAALRYITYSKPEWNNHYRPFFLYLAYTIPHANNELAEKTGNGMEVPSDEPYSGETWPQVEKNKAAMITRLDTYVGKIMEVLRTNGMDKNTVVFFSSDNGGHKEGGVDPSFFHSNGPLRGIKRDLYEGGIRVPFIAWWPGHVKAGTTSDRPAAFWDFLPTAAELARIDAPANIDGISILPAMLGQPQTNRHEFLYWEFHEGGFKQAVRMGDWKTVRFGSDGPLQLYNLKGDIGEKTDVAESHPEIVAKIEDYLKTARTPDTNWPTATAAKTSKLEYGANQPAGK